MNELSPSFGSLLQSRHRRRRFSQLDLAVEAGISERHLSFVETGRAMPSREMVLHLAGHLDVPARERNALLVAAGFAPVLRDRGLDGGFNRSSQQPDAGGCDDGSEAEIKSVWAEAAGFTGPATGGGSRGARTLLGGHCGRFVE